jgi:hypothetical protein
MTDSPSLLTQSSICGNISPTLRDTAALSKLVFLNQGSAWPYRVPQNIVPYEITE